MMGKAKKKKEKEGEVLKEMVLESRQSEGGHTKKPKKDKGRRHQKGCKDEKNLK